MSGLIASLPKLLYSNVLSPVMVTLQDVAPNGYTLLGALEHDERHNRCANVTVEMPIADLDLLVRIKWIYTLLPLLFYFSAVPLCLYYLGVLIFRPINRVRRFGSIGYINHETGAVSKREVANMIRRRRKIGEELPPVFPNGWYRLLDSMQLGKGQVKEVTALGEHFAVFRTHSGEAHVLDAYCPHMGGNLAMGGRVKGNCLECPFHGWTFAGDGKCTDIPYSAKIPKHTDTKSWTCKEINGAIFLWYHCDDVAPQWEIPEMEGITSGRFKYKGRVEHDVNAHIQDIPENGSDFAHFGYVHKPNIFIGDELSKHSDSWRKVIEHIFKTEYKGSSEKAPHISLFHLAHSLKLFGKFSCMHLNLECFQVGPGIVQMPISCTLGEGVLIQTTTPVEPLQQVMTHQLYATWGIHNWMAKLFLAAEGIQIDRDVLIWNNKTYFPRPRLVKEESVIVKYRRWFSQFYSENSPRLQMKSEDNSW